MAATLNVLAIIKDDGERFIFIFDTASVEALCRRLGQMAADPEMNFSWADAAVLATKARGVVRK